MKTNQNSKRNIPAIAYLSEDQLILSVYFEGQFQLIRQKFAENCDFEKQQLSNKLQSFLRKSKKARVSIILSNRLVLYSQLKLPINLSNQEIAELIGIQLSQRQQDSQIDTYYDYFVLHELEDSLMFGLFEARKDKLDTVIQVLSDQGFKIALIIPQALIVLNQIIQKNNKAVKKYQIISSVDDQVIVAQTENEKLIEIWQLDKNKNQTYDMIYPEILSQLNKSDCYEVISFGLNVEKFNQYLSSTDYKITNFVSLSTQSDMTLLIINWMREQYDRYKSVALA